MTSHKTIHNDLLSIQKLIFDPQNFDYTIPLIEPESAEYGAYIFELNKLSIRFRVSKITPTKTGQFVTLWKRSVNGPILPFDISDQIDLFIISSRDKNNFGHFIFPKFILLEQGIISGSGKEGKRAIRVYPPWNITTNRQAQKTQKWQLNYFLDLSNNKIADSVRLKMLYNSAIV
jgi:hypothetical protein